MVDYDEAGEGKGIDLALPGENIRKRHIATRAINKRKITVLVEGDCEFEGYSIGIDEHSLQLLELPSGEVSSIALKYIVSITDSTMFSELSRDEKDIVDRRTHSFRKTSQSWLTDNWPKVYDNRGDYDSRNRQSVLSRKPVRTFYPRPAVASDEHLEERLDNGTEEVRD